MIPTIISMGRDMVDLFGIPEYFVTQTLIEDAGYGMMRLISGIERNGNFVPLYSVVMPVSKLMANAMLVLRRANGLMKDKDISRAPPGHH